MKAINKFIRNHISLIIPSKDESKKIYNDLLEIWDNFSDSYQLHSEHIKAPCNIQIFYDYLSQTYNLTKKYAVSLICIPEESFKTLQEYNAEFDFDAKGKAKYYNNKAEDYIEKIGLEDMYKDICNEYKATLDDEIWLKIVAKDLIIHLYYNAIYGYPIITEHLINLIEDYFDVSYHTENKELNISDAPDIYTNIKLKENVDIKKLHEYLTNKKCISEIPYNEFEEILTSHTLSTKKIDWYNIVEAGKCANIIFLDKPRLSSSRIFSVQGNIHSAAQYADAYHKNSLREKKDYFTIELKKNVLKES